MSRGAEPAAYPLTFEPQVLVKVWGGEKLTRLYGKPASTLPLGESWEVTAVTGHESIVAAGPLAGLRLDELARLQGPALLGSLSYQRHGAEFPLLLKLIDASDDLSVQVHPNEEQARRLGGGARSKKEAWLVLDTDPGARLVHGVSSGLDRAAFEELVSTGRIEECLRFVEVSPGDVVPVPPGTLHAIGKGVVLLELQESSDTTYRFYDYGRLGLDGRPRALHVDEALAVVDLDQRPSRLAPTPLPGPGQRELLLADEVLLMQRWTFAEPVILAPDPARFWLVTTLSGEVTLRSPSALEAVPLPKGSSALIPAALQVELVPARTATIFLGTIAGA